MDAKNFEKLKKSIIKAMGKTHLGGIKGERLHKFLRSITTNLHFKWIEKREMDTEKIFTQLEKDIQGHLVAKAQKDEHKIVKMIVKGHVQIYLTVHSLLLYEKHDLIELKKFVNKFRAFCKKKGLPKEEVEKTVKILREAATAWKKEIDSFRKMINSVWAKAKGGEGWSLALFEKMHKEGFFVRIAERRKFREALKDEKFIESSIGKIRKVKNKEQLEKILGTFETKEQEISLDFEKIFQFIFNTWNHITEQTNRLIALVAKAVGMHEVPERDSEQMKELHQLITDSLDEKYLHALRIDDKQLAAIYSDLLSDIEDMK